MCVGSAGSEVAGGRGREGKIGEEGGKGREATGMLLLPVIEVGDAGAVGGQEGDRKEAGGFCEFLLAGRLGTIIISPEVG